MTAGNLPCNRTEFGGRRWVVAGVGDGASLQLNRTNHNLRLEQNPINPAHIQLR